MISLGQPWILLLLPLPLLVRWLLPPHREQESALRFPFFRRMTEAAGAEPRAGAVILSRPVVSVLAILFANATIAVLPGRRASN